MGKFNLGRWLPILISVPRNFRNRKSSIRTTAPIGRFLNSLIIQSKKIVQIVDSHPKTPSPSSIGR